MPFLCLHCWKSFSSHIDLKLHIKREHLMHLNTDTEGASAQLAESPMKLEGKRKKGVSGGLGGLGGLTRGAKRPREVGGMQVEEEKTSHFVQLDDGTFAEMVEGHEMVAPGHQMLVEDQEGQKMVVVIPEQAETVYVIASRDGAETIVPQQSAALESILRKQKHNMSMMVDSNGDQHYSLDTEVVQQVESKVDTSGRTLILGVDSEEEED